MEHCGKRKQAQGEYHHYVLETCAKIAKYAGENGNKAAIKNYSEELSYSVTEGTVRNFKGRYLEQLQKICAWFQSCYQGRPLLIGK